MIWLKITSPFLFAFVDPDTVRSYLQVAGITDVTVGSVRTAPRGFEAEVSRILTDDEIAKVKSALLSNLITITEGQWTPEEKRNP